MRVIFIYRLIYRRMFCLLFRRVGDDLLEKRLSVRSEREFGRVSAARHSGWRDFFITRRRCWKTYHRMSR